MRPEHWLYTIPLRLRSLFRRGDIEQDLRDEFEFHVEQKTQEFLAKGLAREEARRAAHRAMDGIELRKEECRDMRRVNLIETSIQDVRFGLRMLRKNPGFAATAILTLALGIGANTAIFSVVNALLLQPLPYANPEQLFNVFEVQKQDGVKSTGWSYANFEELRKRNHVFSEMAGAQHHQLTLTGRGEPAIVETSVVTPELFALFAVKPLAGRVFSPEDGKPGAPPVAILSENLWRNSFGADPTVIGSSVALDHRSFTIVGVVPSAFRFPVLTLSEQLWIPLAHDPLFGGWMGQRGGHWLQITGRLKAGVSGQQALAELNTISASLAQEFPAENQGWTANMLPLQDMFVGKLKPALFALLAAVGLVLLIACANIANLLLTRATARAKEMALRTALGAGRTRIIRQLLSETAVLGLFGGGVGIGLAYFGVEALSSLLPDTLPRVNAIRVDTFVLCFAVLLSFVASVVFGLAPAFLAADSEIQANLREGSRAGESGHRRRARGFLAAAEIALAMVLLVAAGLFLRSFSKLTSVHPGFEAGHIVKADISLPRFQYSTPEQWAAFSQELLERMQSQPGMAESAMAVPLPIVQGFINLGFDIPGAPPKSAGESRTADYASVSPSYFRVMGIPLMAGRLFAAQDVSSAPAVAVISQAMAQQYFPNQNPIGRRITVGFPPNPAASREIIGIAGDVRDISLGQMPGPMMYVPFAQAPFWGGGVVVKTRLNTSAVAAALRQEVQKIDKDLPVTDVANLPELIDASVAEQRFRTVLLALFAGIALLLAAIGIFGVIAYSVSRRTGEIGIRVALGASRGAILRLILRETLVLVAAGLAPGIPCAIAASRLAGHLLFGVTAGDPATLTAVTLALGGVAIFAGYIPARRAMRVDPVIALRSE